MVRKRVAGLASGPGSIGRLTLAAWVLVALAAVLGVTRDTGSRSAPAGIPGAVSGLAYTYDGGSQRAGMHAGEAPATDGTSAGPQAPDAQGGRQRASGFAAEDAGAAGSRIGYHATKPEFAQSIREGGFQPSAGGRLGGGGTYVSSDPETALAEYGYHNPGGPAAELLRVRYNPGDEFVFDQAPQAPYVKGLMAPDWADTLTAPSLRNLGGWNSLVRTGPIEVLP